MRQSSFHKVKNEKDKEDRNKQSQNDSGGQQSSSEDINANTLMLFYHPLFQETTKKFLSAIFKKSPGDIQIKFFQFIELNLRIQKALIEQFQVEKAIVSGLNDWSRELTLLNVQSHVQESSQAKPFDLKYHYESIHELNMGTSFSIVNLAKLLENLKQHKAFCFSEYCISIEVFQKFLFDISCNWCQFYDIELFCFFINTIFMQITKGSSMEICTVKSLNQITYLSSPFFKEFNQVKHVYSRYIKKNLKSNFKVWCEWNFQRLNDICQSLIIKLSRIFSDDPRVAEYPILFKDALDNFNKEIVQSASKAKGILGTESPELPSKTNRQQEGGDYYNTSIQQYASYNKGNKKIPFVKKQRSLSEAHKIDENYQDEDGYTERLDKSRELLNEEELHKKEQIFQSKYNNQIQNGVKMTESDDKKQNNSSLRGQHYLNEIEKSIIQKKLKQMGKLLEKQKNEIEQDSHSLKLAYRQAEKSNTNAFKYFQKLLHYKREQQKKIVKSLPYQVTSKLQQHQTGEVSPERESYKKKSNQTSEVKNKQVIDDFYLSHQGKQKIQYNTEQNESILEQDNSFQHTYYGTNLTEQNSSQYHGKKRFLTSSLKRKQESKTPIQQNQSLVSPQSSSQQRQVSANVSRNNVYSQQRQNSIQDANQKNQKELTSFNIEKQNSFGEMQGDPNIPLDFHQKALSKAHQMSPIRQHENIYDNSTPTPNTNKSSNQRNSLRIHTQPNNQHNQSQNTKIIQYNRLQPMHLISPKINDSLLFNQTTQNLSHNHSNSNLFSAANGQLETENKQLTDLRENRLTTATTEYDQSTGQSIQNTKNSRIHSEQDYIFRNASHDSNKPYNLFNKSLFNSSKQKKKISLGDIINLNYLYRPNQTFNGGSTTKSKANDLQDLSLEIKPIRPETTLQQLTKQNNERKNSIVQKVRSQTVGLNEVYPQQNQLKQHPNNNQNMDKLNNSNIFLKPIQPQFTQKYRKLVSQSRYLWQKYLVEDDLFQINDFDRLNNFIEELKNTKNKEHLQQIIIQYTQQELPTTERTLFQFRTPYNRKADIPLMQGKNMKLNSKF